MSRRQATVIRNTSLQLHNRIWLHDSCLSFWFEHIHYMSCRLWVMASNRYNNIQNESTNSMLMFRRCRVACNNCCLSFGREKSCTVRVSNSKNIFNIHRVRFATTAPVHSVLKISNHSWLPFSAWLPAILRPGSWHSPNAGRPRHNILRFRRQHQYRDSSRATTRSTPILCDQIREVWFIKFQRKNEFF